MSNQNVIEIKNLSKVYEGGVEALRDVNLEIKKGEIFGLLGPNGAGKTTLINIIAGLVEKTAGEAKVLGKNIEDHRNFVKANIGVVQQEINADSFFTVEETVNFQAGFFGIDDSEKRTEEILKELSLWDKKDVGGRKLSGGMKRRVMTAKAMTHDPAILFLDEPTAGVDIELRSNIWRLVRKLKNMGKTIILTTHYLEEAEELSDRIGIISGGEIVMVEDKQILLDRYGKRLNEIYLDLVAEHREGAESVISKR